MSKFTPGPWKVDEIEELPVAVIEDTEDGHGICEVALHAESNRANAALIAVAPDMYGDCSYIDYAAPEVPASADDEETVEITVTVSALRHLRATLVKARGN